MKQKTGIIALRMLFCVKTRNVFQPIKYATPLITAEMEVMKELFVTVRKFGTYVWLSAKNVKFS